MIILQLQLYDPFSLLVFDPFNGLVSKRFNPKRETFMRERLVEMGRGVTNSKVSSEYFCEDSLSLHFIVMYFQTPTYWFLQCDRKIIKMLIH